MLLAAAVQTATETPSAGEIGAVIAGSLGLVLGFFLLALIISTIFMMIGAALAGIQGRTFGKAFVAVLITWLLGSLVAGIASIFLTPIGGLIVGLIVDVFIVKGIYSTGFFRALVAYLLSFLVPVIVIVGLVFGLMAAGIIAEDAFTPPENDTPTERSAPLEPQP